MKRLLGAAALLFLLACRDQGPPLPAGAGEYVLTAIDGKSLPYVYDLGNGGTTTIHRGLISLKPDMAYRTSYESTLSLPGDTPAPSTVETSGYWELAGTSLTLRQGGSVTSQGTLNGPTLTFQAGAVVWTYLRD